VGVRHIAFLVDSEQALKDAYETLQASGVPIIRAIDHVSQKSIYFQDPDGNLLEIYYELPHARELFREGRGDRDAPLVFPP
jgi:catechol-2,3-dioxygenase